MAASPLTPLTPGDILIPSVSVMNLVNEVMSKKILKFNLRRGLITEYAHNEAFTNAGIEYYTTVTSGTYDRQLVDHIPNVQDDKISLHMASGQLSLTHTVTSTEYGAWCALHRAGGDVVIHSFVETEPNSTNAMYVAALSFRMIRERGIIYPSYTQSGTWYFNREEAYEYATITS